MKVLSIATMIYGLGAMYVGCGAMYGLASIIAENDFSRNLITKFPLFVITVVWMAITWPWILVKVPSFRQDIIDTGRIAIIFGYAMSAMFTMIYPWVWAWYVSGVLAWYLLMRYHERISIEKGVVS